MKIKPILNIITALPAEAKPLIHFFKLKKLTSLTAPYIPFTVFVNEGKTIYLIVSGIGKISIANATTCLYMLTGGNRHSAFLNIGIAGSLQYDLGTALLAHKIVEYSTQRCWYPFVSSIKKMSKTLLVTHDTPQTTYPTQGMIDMESSAFFATASHFVTQEQVQVLKIISDNTLETQQQLTPLLVENHINNALTDIDMLAQYLLNLSQQEAKLAYPLHCLEDFYKKWHFTFNQQIQLQKLLQQWYIHHKQTNAFTFCQQEKSAVAIIKKLQNQLTEFKYANCLH